MKRLIIALLLATGAQAAAPVITNIIADFKGPSEARITARVSAQIASPTWYVSWGYAHNSQPVDTYSRASDCRWEDTDHSGLGDTTECTVQILRTEPGRRIYVRVRLKDGPDEAVSGCGGSITFTGLTCGGGENYPYYDAPLAGPADVPYPNGMFPKQAVAPSYTFPTIVGVETTNQFTVANDCSDLTTKLSSAVTAAATQDVQVMLNPGIANTCPAFQPPNYTGTHKIVIRSSAADYLLPPPNGRIESRHFPYMAYVNTTQEGAAVFMGASKNHYIFMGVYFTTRSLYPTADIAALPITRSERGTSGDGTTWKFTITGTLPSNLTSGSRIALEGVPALSSTCQPGMVSINAVLSSTTVQFACGSAVVSATPDTTTANRYLIPASSQRIESVTVGACASGNTQLRLASGSRWGGYATNTVIHVAGTGTGMTGLAQRGWRVASVSGRDMCLQSSSGITGTYNANTAALAMDTKIGLIVDASNSTDVWFDRVVVDGQPWPNRTLTALALTNCTGCGVVNSRIVNTGSWMLIDPATGNWVSHDEVGSYHASMAGYAVEMTYAQGVLVQNNYLEGTGILLFSQNGDQALGLPISTNLVARRNEISVPISRMAGGPQSDGMYWPHRHWWECKVCTVVEFSGNYGTYNWSDDVTGAPAIALTTRQVNTSAFPGTSGYVNGVTTPGIISDVLVKDNYFRKVGGVFNASFDSDTNHNGTAPTVRIALMNNIVDDMDWYTYRSDPTTGGPGKNSSFTAGSFAHTYHATGFTADHNTIVRQTGPGPSLIDVSDPLHPHGFTRVTNNIWQDNRTPLAPGGVNLGAWQSNWAGSWKATFATGYPYSVFTYPSGTFTQDPNSSWVGNLMVPGSQNNDQYATWDTSCYVSTSAACNITNTERDTYWGTGRSTDGSFDANSSYAFTGTTPDARLAEVRFQDWQNGNYRLHTASPGAANRYATTDGKDAGADLDQINIARRLIRGLRARLVLTTTATISFTAPVASEACYVTYGSTRVSDSTAARPRNIALTGLTTGTIYNAYVTCGSTEELVSFRTM